MNILKFIGRGLFSNKVIIDESKNKKIYLTFLILVLSILISIVPIFTQIINSSGGSIIESNSLQFDYSLERLTKEYFTGDDTKLDFKINDEGILEIADGKAISDLENKKSVTLDDESTLYYLEIKQEEEITLLVSYVTYNKETEAANYKNISAKASDVANHLAAAYDTGAELDSSNYATSTMYSTFILFEDQFVVSLYKNGSTTKYKTGDDGKLTVSSTSSASSTLSGIYKSIGSAKYKNFNQFYDSSSNPSVIIERWKGFFTEAYKDIKTQTLLINTSIYAGLNLVIILLMSLTIFIMCRFKSSACGKQPYGYCFKMVTFASISPALITLILGFMISSLQSICFLMCVGLRSIFLSTRLTRGEIEEAKPATKK